MSRPFRCRECKDSGSCRWRAGRRPASRLATNSACRRWWQGRRPWSEWPSRFHRCGPSSIVQAGPARVERSRRSRTRSHHRVATRPVPSCLRSADQRRFRAGPTRPRSRPLVCRSESLPRSWSTCRPCDHPLARTRTHRARAATRIARQDSTTSEKSDRDRHASPFHDERPSCAHRATNRQLETRR